MVFIHEHWMVSRTLNRVLCVESLIYMNIKHFVHFSFLFQVDTGSALLSETGGLLGILTDPERGLVILLEKYTEYFHGIFHYMNQLRNINN